ncbi:MAG: DUF4383 domain-containing protein [Parcubacteria group bacterium]|nr:DUF4383 domain-containing protein [Parcubacteria group bacterium]
MFSVTPTLIQKLGLAYGCMFLFVAVMGYIPPFVDERGLLFGLFALDLYDNSLHAFSGVWALVAALISTRQAIVYFKVFGTAYFLDGIMGLFLGNAFLDFGIFQYGIPDNTFVQNFFLNIPHILIGGFAVFVGFHLSKRLSGMSA